MDYKRPFICPKCGESQKFDGLCWGCMHSCKACERKDALLREVVEVMREEFPGNVHITDYHNNCECCLCRIESALRRAEKEVAG